MTLFNKKTIKKITAGIAIASLLTPTVFAQTAPLPPQQIPTIVVNGQTVPAGGSGYTLGAILGGLFDTTAAEAAFQAQLQQTDNGALESNASTPYVVEMANDGESISSPVDAAKAAARRAVGSGKYFSYCDGPGSCARWLRTGVNSVEACGPISPGSNCR
jgi:hypothetical protein